LPTVTPPNASRLPVGTEIEVKTNQALGKDSRVGSEFSMRVDDPVKAQNGETAVPEGAMVYGHISGLNMNHDPAVIRLDFDKLVVNGKSHPFNAQVTQVKTPAMSNQTLKSVAVTSTNWSQAEFSARPPAPSFHLGRSTEICPKARSCTCGCQSPFNSVDP
jgi:hypothetical protein